MKRKKFSLFILLIIFIIGFWVWLGKVIKTQKKIPIKKEVILEIKRRIEEIDEIGISAKSPGETMKMAKSAIFQLAFIGNPGAPYLINELFNEERSINARVIYIQILGAIENKESVPYLVSILKEEKDISLRLQSVISLGMINDPMGGTVLEEALFDEEMAIRVASAVSLVKMGRLDIVREATKNDAVLAKQLEECLGGF